jgi:hypothetical protein
MRWICCTLLAAALALGAGAKPAAASLIPISTVFTGVQDGVDLRAPPGPFQPIPPGSIVNTDHPPFTLGTPPFTATFGGDGRALHAGNPALYAFSDGGMNFWGVRGDGLGENVGVIDFSLPAASVTLLARGTPAGVPAPLLGPIGEADALVRAFDPDGELLGEVVLRNDLPIGFPLDRSNLQLIQFGGAVSRVELVNSGEANSFGVLGLLQATPAPEPSSLCLFGLVAAGGVLYARRRSRNGSRPGGKPS